MPVTVTMSSRRPRPALPRRLLAALLGLGLAVLLAELGLRWFLPEALLVPGRHLNPEGAAGFFELDPEFGFRPRLGSPWYDEHGARRLGDGYPLARRPGYRRLLFLGDSATARRSIELGCRQVFGERGLEYWNAGVESFNTVQEVAYYRAYNHRLDPDHVILTIHNNDFDAIQAAFVNRDGRLTLYTPERRVDGLDPWWFGHSYLYRLYFTWTAGREETEFHEAASAVREALAGLRDDLQRTGTRLTVLVLPPLLPPAGWTDKARRQHRTAVAILGGLAIPHFDLLPVLEQALAAGATVRESPDDWWHPSAEMGRWVARYLREQGFRP